MAKPRGVEPGLRGESGTVGRRYDVSSYISGHIEISYRDPPLGGGGGYRAKKWGKLNEEQNIAYRGRCNTKRFKDFWKVEKAGRIREGKVNEKREI
jgi:hypothetical protein